MSDPLYKKELLRLAADATGCGRLAVPCATGHAHNPTCGDKVTIDIALEDGRIAGIAHTTQACVLTQASASVIGAEITGLNHAEVLALRDAVAEMLNGGSLPPAPFDVFRHFDGAAEVKSRHTCVLLPLDAVLAAFEAVGP